MVVLLERDDGEVGVVDVHELGFGVIGELIRDTLQVDHPCGPLGRAADEVDDRQEPARQLRRLTVAEVFVAFVLDHDRRVPAVGTHLDRIGLTAQIDRRRHGR